MLLVVPKRVLDHPKSGKVGKPNPKKETVKKQVKANPLKGVGNVNHIKIKSEPRQTHLLAYHVTHVKRINGSEDDDNDDNDGTTIKGRQAAKQAGKQTNKI